MKARSSEQVSSLIGQQNELVKGYSAEIKALGDQISRLKEARDSVSAIYQKSCEVVNDIDTYDVGVAWQGNLRESWEELKRGAVKNGNTYCNSVDGVYLSICAVINTLGDSLADAQTGLDAANRTITSLNFELKAAQWGLDR